MEYRALGDSDLRVSEVCLGTWTTFGESVTDDVAVTLVDAAFDDDVPLEETLDAMTEVVAAGKVRYIGVSNWNGDQIRRAVELAREHGFAKIVSSQPQYSLLRRDPEQDVIPASQENGISQIPWSPLAQGVLTGKYRPGASFGGDTRAAARGDGFMSQYLGDDLLERVERLRPIAVRLGITMAQLALAWLLHQPNVASPIVGASRPDQVRDNAAASGIRLDDGTVRAIEDAVAA